MTMTGLACEVCLTKHKVVFSYRQHIQSSEHRQKMQDVFPGDISKKSGRLPYIPLMCPRKNHEIEQYNIDLSRLTLCFTPGPQADFYLCHICEGKCSQNAIVPHLFSGDHYSNSISYTDPNKLRFSWIPCKNDEPYPLHEDVDKRVPRHLQMLHLPPKLMKKLESSTYSEVMQVLSENDKLLKLMEAVLPKRIMIETYQKDSKRKHALLGMQHIVECICGERRHYLCTLCRLTIPTHMIIKHVLSFDHLFCYFKAWHPNTLLSKECYTNYTTAFSSLMLSLTEQTQKIHGTDNAAMKQVILEPAEFNSINFTCYKEALEKLESFKKSSLTTTVTPGSKLSTCAAWSSNRVAICKLRCQGCNMVFDRIMQFTKHFTKHSHQQKMRKYFSDDCGGYNQPVRIYLNIYSYIESKKETQPVVGVPLVVTIITTDAEVESAHVCFACRECFYDSGLTQHFESRKHLINTLLYQNPWRLPFAWENNLDEAKLRSLAWKEQEERGEDHIMLKVLDLPYSVFASLDPLHYPTVMKQLALHLTLLKRDVPYCETYSKLQENYKFPQLGKQFMVMYTEPEHGIVREKFLCLLCERRLLADEFYGHEFSRKHVENFLNRLHPGSLNSTTNNADILLDLAKQAGLFHRTLHIQEIHLDTPIWEPCTYNKTKSILASVKKRKSKEKLDPPIKPQMKLVPRESLKEVDHKPVEGSDQQNDTNKLCVENEQHEEKEDEMPTIKEKEPQAAPEELGTCSEEMKDADETCSVEKEKTEDTSLTKPSGEMPESCQNTDKEEEADAEIERGNSNENASTDVKNHSSKVNKRKRPNSESEASHENTSCNKDVEAEIDHKRMRVSSSEDACSEEPSTMPNCEQKDENTADVKETCKAETDTGLSKLLKCQCDNHDPIYLCESCTLRFSEKDVISHITSLDHPKMCLMVVELDEEDYREISKQSHASAIQRVKAIQAQQDGRCELPSTSASCRVESTDISDDHTEEMKIDEDPDSEAAVDMSVIPETTSKTAQVLSELKEEDTVTDIQVPVSEDNSPTSPAVPSSRKEKPSACATTRGVDETCLPPENTKNDSKACITPTVESLKMATTCTVEEPSAAGASISTATTSTCVSTSSKMTATTSASSETVLSASKVKATLCKATPTSQTGPSVVHDVPSCTMENHPKYFQSASKATVQSQTVATSVEVKHLPETSVKSVNTEASAKTAHASNSVCATPSVGPHVHKSIPPRAPPLTTDMPAQSEHKKLSHSSTTDTKPSTISPNVGASQLIIVTCNGKQQVYCRLCSLRMKTSGHLRDIRHQQKYVLHRYPGWTAEPSEWESKLNSTVAHLAKVEKRSTSSQMIEVKSDLYKALSELPEDKAVEKLKTMVRPNSTNSTACQGFGMSSPCEVSSSDDGITVGNPSADPQDTDSTYELIDLFAQIPDRFFRDTEQQNQLSHSEDRGPEPGNHNALQAPPRILKGEPTSVSNRLSSFLSVNKMDSLPIIGLNSMWECRGISLNPFYLCESCRTTLSLSEICDHLVSAYHHLHYMLQHYPQFMEWIKDKDLLLEMKYEILYDVARKVSLRERSYKYDVQGIMLEPVLYERVRTAPFIEALKTVRRIKNQEKLTAHYLPISNPQQKNSQPKKNRDKSLSTETQSVQAPKTNQRHGKEVEQKSNLEETAMVGGRRAVSPLDVNVSSSMAASDLSQFPRAGTSLLSAQAEFTPIQTQSQFSTVNTPVGPGDESLSARKRPADKSVETRVRPCVTNPLEDSLPAKRSDYMLQPVNEHSSGSAASEFTVVPPAVTPTPLSLQVKDAETECEEHNAHAVDLLLRLISVVRKERASSCANTSSHGVEGNLDSESKTQINNTRWESQVFPTTTKEDISLCNSSEGMFLTESSVHQHIAPSARTASSAISSSFEDGLIGGNSLCTTTAGESVVATVPVTTTAAEPSVALQNVPGNVSPSGSVCAATTFHPEQMQRSQADTVIYGTPINTITRARTHAVQRVHTEVNTLKTGSSSDASFEGCSQYNQMSHAPSQHTGCFPPYVAPNITPVYTWDLNPHVVSPSAGLYSGQIYPQQGVNYYGLQTFCHSLAAPRPPQCESLEMQQQHQQQQHQPFLWRGDV
ncbi:uncharacterized protein LOC125020411 isoform X2 [Mugil cephalus]|uniref:uncharacterized protein LOC125020411 isoform X2 n=1 Tax=Mugil cephalus TaxID=48193 RepID=UPI001FB69706|nr:uncharacterized protein LOC125020411 isoform X2 [Mugil cephalus]